MNNKKAIIDEAMLLQSELVRLNVEHVQTIGAHGHGSAEQADAAAKCLQAYVATKDFLATHLSAPAGETVRPAEVADGEKLWIWKNGENFLAFRHLYPCFTQGGDPMTLGEPIGYAIFKNSHDRNDVTPVPDKLIASPHFMSEAAVQQRATQREHSRIHGMVGALKRIQEENNTPSAPDMVSVKKQDANNYCRILTLLGMEEEGDPVAEVERLVNVQAVETVRPDILEKLTYHRHECDDLTLDECLDYLANGWRKVHGRTERQLILQLVRLMASVPQAPACAQPLSDEQIVDLFQEWNNASSVSAADLIDASVKKFCRLNGIKLAGGE